MYYINDYKLTYVPDVYTCPVTLPGRSSFTIASCWDIPTSGPTGQAADSEVSPQPRAPRRGRCHSTGGVLSSPARTTPLSETPRETETSAFTQSGGHAP